MNTNVAIDRNTHFFVTGGTGFIGSYILRTLLKEGYSNITAIKRETSRLDLLGEASDKINWVTASLDDLDIIENELAIADVVIHAAAIVSFNKKRKNQLHYSNVELVRDLINLSLENNIKKFIHISSIAALGRGESGKLISESTEWKDSPLNSEYGKSKYLGEMEVWRGMGEGLDVVVLNPSLVMGAGHWKRTTPAIFREVENGHKYFPLGGNGMVDVRDVAKAVILSLQPEIVNDRFLLNAGNITYQEMFSTIAKEINATIPTKPLTTFLHAAMVFAAKLMELLPIRISFSSQQLKILNHQSNYDAQHSIDVLKMSYRPMHQTLIETAAAFNESKKENKNFATLNLP